MKSDNHAETIDRILKSISYEQESDFDVELARKLILSDLDRIGEKRSEFEDTFAAAICHQKITWGCATVQLQRAEGRLSGMDHSHGEPATTAVSRTPIGWGGGTCWYFGRCWVCIEYECRA